MILSSKIRYLTSLLLTLTMLGCASSALKRDTAATIAEDAGLSRAEIDTGTFVLVVFHRGLGQGRKLHVYVEGDGHAWRSKTRISRDPTPSNPVALRLAALDPAPAVLYIARACQYQSPERLARCDSKYWSVARYAPEVIDATEAVIEWAKLQNTDGQSARLGLVGYSGGATVAALVAAQRADVDWLITLAGNLDHRFWTELHGLTPLFQSLNPTDFTRRLAALPQRHFVGAEDDNVPISVARHYLTELGISPANTLIEVKGFTHTCCWETLWPQALCDWKPAGSECGHLQR